MWPEPFSYLRPFLTCVPFFTCVQVLSGILPLCRSTEKPDTRHIFKGSYMQIWPHDQSSRAEIWQKSWSSLGGSTAGNLERDVASDTQRIFKIVQPSRSDMPQKSGLLLGADLYQPNGSYLHEHRRSDTEISLWTLEGKLPALPLGRTGNFSYRGRRDRLRDRKERRRQVQASSDAVGDATPKRCVMLLARLRRWFAG